MHSGVPRCKFQDKNERIVSYRKKQQQRNLYPGNLWGFFCLKIVTWVSVILVRVPGRFPNAAVFRSRSFDFDVRTTLGTRAIGMSVKNKNKKSLSKLIVFRKIKIKTCSRRKMVIFCIAVIFVDRLHRTKQIWQVKNLIFLPRDCNVTQRYREAGRTGWDIVMWNIKRGPKSSMCFCC